MNDVNTTITNKLTQVEATMGVRVLYAVESGSRAWGFASPDSDFDVRFIYMRPLREYLRLENTSDVIEYELNEVMDIVGWDLPKSLRLFHKSNPSLFEWLGSPVVYKTTDAFERIRPVLNEHYNKKHGFYHYHSMAKKNYLANFKYDRVKLKKYFYVLRPILACRWIINHDSPPPVLFDDLVRSELEPDLMQDMEALLARKFDSAESEKVTRLALWDHWINENLSLHEGVSKGIHAPDKLPWNILNEIFWDMIHAD